MIKKLLFCSRVCKMICQRCIFDKVQFILKLECTLHNTHTNHAIRISKIYELYNTHTNHTIRVSKLYELYNIHIYEKKICVCKKYIFLIIINYFYKFSKRFCFKDKWGVIKKYNSGNNKKNEKYNNIFMSTLRNI